MLLPGECFFLTDRSKPCNVYKNDFPRETGLIRPLGQSWIGGFFSDGLLQGLPCWGRGSLCSGKRLNLSRWVFYSRKVIPAGFWPRSSALLLS
jgi:hypothetical protein